MKINPSTRHQLRLTFWVSALFMLVGYGLTFVLYLFLTAEIRRLGSFAAVWEHDRDWFYVAGIFVGHALMGTFSLVLGIVRYRAWKRAGYVEYLPDQPMPEFVQRLLVRWFGFPQDLNGSDVGSAPDHGAFVRWRRKAAIRRVVTTLVVTVAMVIWFVWHVKR